MRDTAWVQRRAAALCAWACRCVVALTDCILEAALARIGESMEWEDVERLAQDKIEEEQREAMERWEARQEKAKPVLRLLSKP